VWARASIFQYNAHIPRGKEVLFGARPDPVPVVRNEDFMYRQRRENYSEEDLQAYRQWIFAQLMDTWVLASRGRNY
jgi:hypothetical protein